MLECLNNMGNIFEQSRARGFSLYDTFLQIVRSKIPKNAAKNDLLIASQAYINETGPRQLILTSNIKHHKTRSNIGIALSAVQYLGGLGMDARTLKEANFREGRDHYYNWTMDIDCSCHQI